MGTNGRVIIKEAIAHCPRLTDEFVDVDEEIASTHDLELDEVLPFGVINEVCRKAKTLGGVIGFDARVDSAGNVHVFKRGKYISTVDLTNKIINYERSIDVHRVRNKIKVYGKAERPWSGSVSKDNPWTEELTNWFSSGISGLDEDAILGSYSIHFENTDVMAGWLGRTFNSIKIGKNRNEYKELRFHIKVSHSIGADCGEVTIRIGKDDSNYFVYRVNPPKLDTWEEKTLSLGPDTVPIGITGTPSWNDIAYLRFYLSFAGMGTITIKIDALHFWGRRFEGFAQDTISIAKYGTRWNEPQVDDELTSDVECELKAKSLIDFLKDPITSLRLQVEGDNNFVAGYRQRVIIANINLDAYFRILEIRHEVINNFWHTFLTLSNEPKIIDYIFASSSAPRYAGASIIVPRDFSNIQEGVNVVVV